MKSVSIHNMDENLYSLIDLKARNDGVSINKEIKQLLQIALGMKVSQQNDRRREFEKFCGVWSQQDAREFEQAVQDFETIDESDWQ